MDVVMIGPRMFGIVAEDGFEYANGLERACFRCSVRLPKLPGPEFHEALGVQHGCIQVVRVLLGETAHGVLVSSQEIPTARMWIGRIALGQGLDVMLLIS